MNCWLVTLTSTYVNKVLRVFINQAKPGPNIETLVLAVRHRKEIKGHPTKFSLKSFEAQF